VIRTGNCQPLEFAPFVWGFLAGEVRAVDPAFSLALETMREGFRANLGFRREVPTTGRVLSELAQGSGEVTTQRLRQHTVFQSVDPGFERILWEATERMTDCQRSRFLRFMTGLFRFPRAGEFKLTVQQIEDDRRLPEAHTCGPTLVMPFYSSTDIAYEKLVLAIESCQSMHIM
jgi:hypothetical protein